MQYLIPPKGLLSKWWAVPFFNYSVRTHESHSMPGALCCLLNHIEGSGLHCSCPPPSRWH